ncbi:Chloroplastic lipocalin [Vitis vinifera]|uniref:Chloroplastic lipocalin n=1 Tax=Vitis vinifera TaxID=29760 RepID=A0A438DXW8_VITVI|nr:Chloroplastic lipocalin [Vitis vinifera]
MMHLQTTTSSRVVLLQSSSSPPIRRGMPSKLMLCSFEHPTSSKAVARNVLSGLAASVVILSQANQARVEFPLVLVKLTLENNKSKSFRFLVELQEEEGLSHPNNLCQLASATSNTITLPLDEGSGERSGKLMMMRGMSAKDFDPVRYSGRWFEVASLKRGFAGQGKKIAIALRFFSVKTVYSGIPDCQRKVQCLEEEELEKSATDLEKQVMIREKCYLRFPTLPFIPKEPYDVIATDYDTFALVSGAKDRSFIQIYSRTPNPGPKFIEKYKAYLANFGYDPSKIKDTPQDCEVMSNSKLAAMMSMSGMQQALTNQFPDLGLKSPIEFNPFTSVFDTLKKLVELYFK